MVNMTALLLEYGCMFFVLGIGTTKNDHDVIHHVELRFPHMLSRSRHQTHLDEEAVDGTAGTPQQWNLNPVADVAGARVHHCHK